eukprot:TRINITY_DN9820_c0_g2_i1.p1 TRINITY_DN9820_c0_g2~~TRINITY_DN9820_c0_g2_i1.p1  ORF type:complete len:503 (-),score=91.94 TRINITY_DN9820_c0_g2_i1:4-1512(-)
MHAMGTASCKQDDGGPVTRGTSAHEVSLGALDAEALSPSRQAVTPVSLDRLQEVLDGLEAALDARCMVISPSTRNDLCEYSPLARAPYELKAGLVLSAVEDTLLNRMMGSMVGMAVGDALGHPFEFEPAQDVPGPRQGFDLKTMRFHGEYNKFRLRRGQWTDDAAMGLCMADSLIFRRGFDGSDMRVRFWCWWNRGYNNAFRKDPSRSSSVGLGGNISKSLAALSRMRPDQKVPPAFEAGTEDAGNGSLMRLTPVALFFHGAEILDLHRFARLSSYTTHPGKIAAEACAFLAHLIARALHRPPGPVDPKAFLDEATDEYYRISGLASQSGWGYDQMKWLVTSKPVRATESCWDWRRPKQNIAGTLRARGRQYNGYPVSAEYFGAFAVDGIALALWAVYHTTSFDEAVARSVNLFGDADSHGSITGQLAGALYGYSSIHPQFKAWLNAWDDHEFAVRALLLQRLGSAWSPAAAANPPTRVSTDDNVQKVGSIPKLSRAHTAAS